VVNVFSHSEPGGHPDNQDAFAVIPHPEDPQCLLCAVADGQGGQAGGAAAARLACRAWVEGASAQPPGRLSRPDVWAAVLRGVDDFTLVALRG
jgi:serine/threonine protein phosphatase PrpC